MADIRILLLGKTGAGKSAAGNKILGKVAFEEKFSSQSVTKKCQENFTEVNGQRITVIDTPGLYDTTMEEITLKKEISNLFNYSGDGFHVILLVMELGRYTAEEQNTVKWIQENFGKEASKYTMVLFTYGEMLQGTMEDFLKDGKKLQSLVDQCKGGYHVFSNNKSTSQNQVTGLLTKIEGLKDINKNEGYEKNTYDETQKKLYNSKLKKRALIGTAVVGLAGAGIGATIAITALKVGAAAAAAAAAAGGTAGAAASAGGTAASGLTAGKVIGTAVFKAACAGASGSVMGAAGGALTVPVEDAFKSSSKKKSESEEIKKQL